MRIGQYAADLFDLDLPQADKRLSAFVETDGCLIDGITAATGCAVGHRTMRILDYGKTAATFVDTRSNRAVRVLPSRESRSHARDYAPDRWHAQLIAYQIMPTAELLSAEPVRLTVALSAMISRHGLRCCANSVVRISLTSAKWNGVEMSCVGLALEKTIIPSTRRFHLVFD